MCIFPVAVFLFYETQEDVPNTCSYLSRVAVTFSLSLSLSLSDKLRTKQTQGDTARIVVQLFGMAHLAHCAREL